MASACDKPGSTMDSSKQNKRQGYQNDEDCYSFKSEGEYDYSFIDKDYYFGNPDEHNICNDSRSHFSQYHPDDINDDLRNIWSAIHILYSRNIETGKFYMSTITEETEKSKELQDKLTEKIIEVERLKGEIKVLKLLNDNLIKENTSRPAAMRFESAALTTEELSQPRRTSRHDTPQRAPDIQKGKQYQLLANCDDDDSLEETKTPFEIELENVKLRKKTDYLQHKLKGLESKELNTRTNQTQNNRLHSLKMQSI